LKPAIIKGMLAAGMDVARLNFSHGSPDSHAKAVRMIRDAADSLRRPCPILADLPGPKVRIGELKDGGFEWKQGDKVFLSLKPLLGIPGKVSVEFPHLPKSLKPGGLVFMNDGLIQLKADKVGQAGAWCTVVAGGPIKSRKGFALPGARIPVHPPTPLDLELFRFGLSQGIDAFGVSFVASPKDLLPLRQAALPRKPALISKLERIEALEHATALYKASDGIMIARGDLGVNLPLEEVPLAQKALTRLGNVHHTFTITATQMMQSLSTNLRPTRAEVSDVANTVLDGSEAVMLSDETAAGVDPVNAVFWMDRVAKTAEKARRQDGGVKYPLG
jgi:pyruvate kinase